MLLLLPASLVAQSENPFRVSYARKNLPAPEKTPAILKKGVASSGLHRYLTVYDASDGLALSSVLKIVPDSEGNLWMATAGGGVSRFDGHQFQTYSVNHGLASNVVRGIVKDSSGNVWFGTQGGLTHFDGLRFTTYNEEHGLSNNAIYDIVIDKQFRLWAGTLGGGVSMFASGKFTNYTTRDGLASNFVRSLHVAADGRLWIGTMQGVSVMEDQKIVSFPFATQLSNAVVYAITSDHANNVWFATSEGLVRFDGRSLKRFSTDDGLPDKMVLSVKEDSKGNLWVGTHEGGVCRFDGRKFEIFDMSTGMPNNRVWSIAEHANGTIWFATQGGGVCRYAGDALTLFDRRQGMIHSNVWGIAQDNSGYLWIATDHGVSRFDGSGFDNLLLGKSQPENLVSSVTAEDGDNIWFATDVGAVHYDGRQITRYTTKQGLPDNRVRKIIKTADGSVWVGTIMGLAKFTKDSVIHYTTHDGLVHNNVRSLLQDRRGNLWITTGGGISVFDGKRFENFTTRNKLFSNACTRMFEDKQGNIWIGTHGEGLMRYDGKTFIDIGKRQGLPDGVVYAITGDNEGNLWIGTNQGFFKLFFRNGNEIIRAAHASVSNSVLDTYVLAWEEFNRKTNYPLDDVNSGAICIPHRPTPLAAASNENTVWGGFGNDFLVRLKPDQASASHAPQLRITNIRLNGRQVSWNSLIESDQLDSVTVTQQELIQFGKLLCEGDRDTLRHFFSNISFENVTPHYLLPEKLVLPYTHNHLTFEFNAIEVGGMNRISYQFKLEGEDKLWSSPTTRTEATFNNLWEGEYTFHVRYRDRDNDWSPVQSFSFTILPPVWRTWWMICAYVIGLTALVSAIIHLRVKMLRREKKMLEDLVHERTREVVSQKEEAERQRKLVEEMNEEIRIQLEQIERDLSEQTLQMIHRHNTLAEIETEIKNSAAGLEPKQLNKLLQMVSINKSLDKEWDTFNNYFTNVHKEFYQKLRSVAAGLSIHEQRLAALVRMSLENREIATLLNIEVGSVKMAKYRLKKKIGLNESEDLFEFISKL